MRVAGQIERMNKSGDVSPEAFALALKMEWRNFEASSGQDWRNSLDQNWSGVIDESYAGHGLAMPLTAAVGPSSQSLRGCAHASHVGARWKG